MSAAPKTAVFPGTFDPLTNGHLDVIRRGQHLFDRVVVAIGHNPEKRALFTIAERREMIAQIVAEECTAGNVQVETYEGLTVDYARRIGAVAILRGLRNVSDLNFEFQLALTNRAVADIETIFIMSGEVYGFTSSSLIRQVAAGGDIDRLHRLLPRLVIQRLREKKASGGLSIVRHDGLKD
jgi:pantetheine-phosphate adenylyltransferase